MADEPKSPESVLVTIQVPPEKAERVIRALERVACTDFADCLVDEYRQRVKAAFARYCPEKPYTGTALDLDTLFAVIEVRAASWIRARRKEDHPDASSETPKPENG